MLYCSFWVRFLWLLTQGIDDKIAEMKYCSTLYCFGWCLHGLFNKAHVFTFVELFAQCSVSRSLAMQWTGYKYCGPIILLSGKMYRFVASNAKFGSASKIRGYYQWYPLIYTSGDVSSGFQSQSGHPYSHLQSCMGCPRDSPLVQHLLASWQPQW